MKYMKDNEKIILIGTLCMCACIHVRLRVCTYIHIYTHTFNDNYKNKFVSLQRLNKSLVNH